MVFQQKQFNTHKIYYQDQISCSENMQNRQNSGKRIQNYVFSFSDCIGKGNFSKVYKAYHEITNEVFAIKIIELSSLKSKKLEELLFSEIDVLKKLNHPNVLKCYEVFTSNRHCYIITELCSEGDLEAKLRKKQNFSENQAEGIVRDVFSGLLYLSQMNIVHRDFKVANIFMHNGKAKIADFGFAKFTTEKWKDISIGSPIYMSPEGLIDNIYGPKTDVWAFGIMLYEFFHGESPFARCKTENDLKRAILKPLTWNNLRMDISAEIKQVILRCLQVNEEKRCTIPQLKYSPYLRRLLDNENKVNQTRKIYHIDTVNARSSDLIKPQSTMEFDPMYQTRSRNLVQTSSGNKNQKIFSPLCPRPSNGLGSPMINQSLSLEKFTRNSRFTSQNQQQQQQHQQNYFLSPSQNTLKQVGSGPNLHRLENSFYPYGHPRSQQSSNHFEEPIAPKSFENRSSTSPILVSGTLTFKECVNLLHYCRLLYKYVTANRSLNQNQQFSFTYNDENFCKLLTAFLLNCLSEISEKVQTKGISYDGENVWLREKKLREVTDQYTKKYSKELPYNPNFNSQNLTLSSIRQHSHNGYLELDSLIKRDSPTKMILLGHSILVLWHSTRLLEQCFESRNYKNFGSYKDVEGFLNKSKNGVDYESYKSYKKKLVE